MLHNQRERQAHKLTYQHQLANQLVTAVIVLDEKLTIQYVNPAAEAMLVKSFNKLFNLAFVDVFKNSSIDASRLQQVIESGQEFTDSDVIITFAEHYKFTAEITASAVEFNQKNHVLLELSSNRSTKTNQCRTIPTATVGIGKRSHSWLSP